MSVKDATHAAMQPTADGAAAAATDQPPTTTFDRVSTIFWGYIDGAYQTACAWGPAYWFGGKAPTPDPHLPDISDPEILAAEKTRMQAQYEAIPIEKRGSSEALALKHKLEILIQLEKTRPSTKIETPPFHIEITATIEELAMLIRAFNQSQFDEALKYTSTEPALKDLRIATCAQHNEADFAQAQLLQQLLQLQSERDLLQAQLNALQTKEETDADAQESLQAKIDTLNARMEELSGARANSLDRSRISDAVLKAIPGIPLRAELIKRRQKRIVEIIKRQKLLKVAYASLMTHAEECCDLGAVYALQIARDIKPFTELHGLNQNDSSQ